MIAVYELSNGSVRRIDVTEWGPVPPADGAIRWARAVGAEDQEFLALLGALGCRPKTWWNCSTATFRPGSSPTPNRWWR